MDTTKTLIYDTLIRLADHAPEQHAQIRQHLYEQLELPFSKQVALYTNVLAPASLGRLDDKERLDNAVNLADSILNS